MKHLDLFSGIGGFSLSARWAGIETIGVSEIDSYCCKVLAKNFPGVPNYGDITKLDGRTITADLITGGFPCQPFSLAGQQQGQDDKRYLWPEMLRVIAECQPAWVVAENVPGIIGLALERVCADLEGIGFEVQPLVIPACAVNAPHRRDRIWVVAYASRIGKRSGESSRCNARGNEQLAGTTPGSDINNLCQTKVFPPDASRNRGERPTGQDGQPDGGGQEQSGVDLIGSGEAVADASQFFQRKQTAQTNTITDEWNTREEFGSRNGGLAQSELCREHDGLPPRLDEDRRGRINCEPGVSPLASNIKNRMNRLRGLGNAIVPQIAYQILKAIKDFHTPKEGTRAP